MKKSNIITTTYKCEKGFMIDIVIAGYTTNVWIYHRDYAIKLQLFGVVDESLDDVIAMTQAQFNKCMMQYAEEYMEQDDIDRYFQED